MSRIHLEAAKVLKEVVSEKKGLRAAFYKDKAKVDTKVYALASRAVKLYEQLDAAFSSLFEEDSFSNRFLGIVIAAELLSGKASKSGGKARRLVEGKLDELRRLVQVSESSDKTESDPPRFLRFVGSLESLVTAIKSRLSIDTEIFKHTEIPDVVEFVDGKILGAVMRDSELNSLVSKSPNFFLQDKSTCLTPHVLLSDREVDRKNVHVLDVCSSPGSKALHIFSKLRPGDSLTLVERDQRRFKELQRRLTDTIGLKSESTQGVIGGIKIKLLNMDFIKFKSPSVTHINLDPSCSGSGLHTHHNRVSKDSGRLEKLAEMQKTLLKHACNPQNFPGCQIVCYSTCSVFEEENENVARDAAVETKGFQVDASAPKFVDSFRKGRFFQVTPDKHGCRGFFLAKFKRPLAKKELKLAKRS